MSKSASKSECICLALVTVLCLVTISFSVFLLVSLKTKENKDSEPHRNFHLILDGTQIIECPKEKITAIQVPCFKAPNEYVNKEGSLGPLKCKDDFFDEEGGTSFCETSRDTFHLNGDRNAVVVQKPGIYRFYGQVTFKDKNAEAVIVILRINEHSFVQCHQENWQPKESETAPYTTCSLNGERRLREGDKVSLHLPNSFRTINAYYKITFWGLVRVAD